MKKSALKTLSLLVAAGLADCGVAAAADLYPALNVPAGAFILPTANVATASPPTVPSITALDAAVGSGGTFVAPGASSGPIGSANSTVDTNAQLSSERISLDPPAVVGPGAGGYQTIPNSRDMAAQGAMGPARMGPPSSTLDPYESGRVINNSHNGDWFDYCGPKGNACCSQIYGAADVWLLDRKDATLKQLALNSTDGSSALNTVSPNFRWDQVAPRLTVGRLFCDWAVEGNILYIDDISAHADARNINFKNAVFFGVQPAGSNYTNANTMRVDIYDGLHSYEINAVDTRSFFQMLYGFRYIEFREHLGFQSTADATGTSNAEIGTYNRMFGAQIGLRMNYIGELADWEFNLKGGMYQNDQVNSTLIRDNNNTVLIRNTRTGGQNEAYEAEATLAVNYRISNSLKARFGYQLMYIGEIALAPDQIDENRTAAGNITGFINDAHGDMFLRGFTGGVEYRW
jgi:hypothetical protein